jgi:methyl-accepting chemotaxis protein
VLQDTKTSSARIAELALKEGSGLLALRAQTLANKEAEGAYQGAKRDIQQMLEQVQSKLAEQADSSTLLVARSMSDLKRSSEYRMYASQALETTSAIQINIRRLLGAVQLVMLSSGDQEIQRASVEVIAARAQLSSETDALKRGLSLKGVNSAVNISGIHDALRKADAAIADVIAAKATVAANERAMQTTIASIKKITEEQSRQGDAKVKDISAKFGDVVSSLNRTVASATTIMILVSSLVVISIIIFAVGTAFSITRPLKMTTDAIVNIAEGDGNLTERLPATRKDELGKLSEGFNKLIDKLQGNISTLASKVDTIVSAAMDLSATSEQLAVGAQAQLDQTVTLSRTSEEISRVSLNLANEAREATEYAEATKVVALSGNMVVGSTVAGIKSVSVTLTGITNSIGDLAQHSLKIGEITTVIRDIADQTNLLALNAAIEAARAGEQGRGFAVVADSVRRLSEKTSSATVEIDGMIKAIQKGAEGVSVSMNQGLREVHVVVESANQAGETLKDIVNRIGKKTDMIQHMAAAAHQQSVAVDSMGDGIEAVVTVSKEFAAGSQKIAQTAGVLSKTANTLQEVARQFRT